MTALYKDGTITLVNGSPLIIGNDTAWAVSLIVGGTVLVEVAGGNSLPILPDDSDGANLHPITDTNMTSAINWTGPSGTFNYAIVRDMSYTRQQSANADRMGQLIEFYDNPTVAAISSIEGLQDHLIVMTGPTTAALVSRASLLRGANFNKAVETLAGRAAFDLEEENFSLLVGDIGDGRAAIYVKRSGAAGDWLDPSYVTGIQGDKGDFTTVTFDPVETLPANQNAGLVVTETAPGAVSIKLRIPRGLAGDMVGPSSAVVATPAGFADTTGKTLRALVPAELRGFLGLLAQHVAFDNATAKITGVPATVQTAIENVASVAFSTSSTMALELADIKGTVYTMNGLIADTFDDQTGINLGVGGVDAATVSLLHFDTAPGKNVIIDSGFGQVKHSWSALGDAVISSAQSVFGGASLALDGTGDYIIGEYHPDFIFGTADFTIECRIRRNAAGVQHTIYDARTAASSVCPLIYIPATNVIQYHVANATRITGTTVTAVDTWYSVAVSRVNGVTRLFVNGVQEGIDYADANIYVLNALGPRIGADLSGANGLMASLMSFVSARLGDTPPPTHPQTQPLERSPARSRIIRSMTRRTAGMRLPPTGGLSSPPKSPQKRRSRPSTIEWPLTRSLFGFRVGGSDCNSPGL